MIINIDGTFIEPNEARLPISDGALLFGDSLFETLKAYGQRLRFLDHHLDRIELSARMLDFPCDRQKIRKALLETAQRLQAPVSRIRLTISRGNFAGLGFPPPKAALFIITALPYEEPTENERSKGIACVFAPNRRVNPLSHLPQMKRGNYADCLYAANHARKRGAREAIFVTKEDQILEGATSNLFIVKGGKLFTPPAGDLVDLVLAGIMRRQVLQVATELGIPTQEHDVSKDDLFGADEMFITNTLIDLLPVASVEGQALSRGTLWGKLLENLEGRT